MSLNTCLIKHAQFITKADESEIRDTRNEYIERGMSESEAAEQAIIDRIDELKSLRSRIEGEVLAEFERVMPDRFKQVSDEIRNASNDNDLNDVDDTNVGKKKDEDAEPSPVIEEGSDIDVRAEDWKKKISSMSSDDIKRFAEIANPAKARRSRDYEEILKQEHPDDLDSAFAKMDEADESAGQDAPEGFHWVNGKGPIKHKWGLAKDGENSAYWNYHENKQDAIDSLKERLKTEAKAKSDADLQKEFELELAKKLIAGELATDKDIERLDLKPQARFDYLSPVVQRLFGIRKLLVRKAMGDALYEKTSDLGAKTTWGNTKKALANAATFSADKVAPEISIDEYDKLKSAIQSPNGFIGEELSPFRKTAYMKRLNSALNDKDKDNIQWAKGLIKSLDENKSETKSDNSDTKKTERTNKSSDDEIKAIRNGNIPNGLQPKYVAWIESLSDKRRKELFSDDYSHKLRNSEYMAWASKDSDQQKTISQVEYQQNIRARSNSGDLKIDEFKSAFESLIKNREQITAEISKFSKDKLISMLGPISASRAKTEKKEYAIESVYRNMVTQYYYIAANAGMMSVPYSNRADHTLDYIDATRPHVEAATQDRLDEVAKGFADSKRELEESKKRKMDGLKDPKTLDDFRNLHRAILEDNPGITVGEARMKMTADQRIEYDRLNAIDTRSKRVNQKETRKTSVSSAGQTVDGSIIETKHTKKGHDLFVVQLAERVSKEDYNTLSNSAKRLGGYYSSFRGSGAVPGFQFPTKESAQAFLELAGGNTETASELAKELYDVFQDNKSQSTAERLRSMAAAMSEHAEQELTRDRKANTTRRAGMAARALESAEREKAMAETMQRIAEGIESGQLELLDKMRTKAQLSQIQAALYVAKGDELRSKYPDYSERIKHEGEPITTETVDHAAWPTYTAFRSDLAKLARQMIETDGLKMLGRDLLKVADDTSAEYTKFAKENLYKVSVFMKQDGSVASFKSKAAAAESIEQSGFSGKAIPLEVKRGETRIILSASEAQTRGIWEGADKRIDLTADFAEKLIETAAKKNRKKEKVSVPWQLETAYEKRQRFKSMGIETAAEFRAALREYVSLAKQPEATSKVKKLELAMVGRKNDGLDFFPTPQSIADEMIQSAEIQAGMSVLEPSAGMGHIADRIREFGAEPDAIEISESRRELLEAKGYNLVGRDFMEYKNRDIFGFGDTFKADDGSVGILRGHGGLGSDRVMLVDENGDGVGKKFFSMSELTPVKMNGTGSGYDRIIMNPPFSDRRDMDHVLHAYDLLKPGGRIVAIVGEGVMFGSDKKATGFRDWLDRLGATSEKLEEGTFNDPSLPVTTGVNARMLVIDKPVVGNVLFSLDDKNKEKDSKPKLTKAEAQAIVDRISKNWAVDVSVKIAESIEDFPDHIKSQLHSADGKKINALFDPATSTAWINLSEVNDVDMIERMVFHEVYAHLGFRKLFGKEVTALMGRLYMQMGGDKAVRALAKKYGMNLQAYEDAFKDQPLDMKYAIIAEEILAHMSEDHKPSVMKTIQELIGAIREWLRKNGFAELSKISESDLRHLIKQSKETITKGKKGEVTGLIYSLAGIGKADRRMMNREIGGALRYSLDDLPSETRKMIKGDGLLEFWGLIALRDEAFKYPRSESKDIDAVFLEVARKAGFTLEYQPFAERLGRRQWAVMHTAKNKKTGKNESIDTGMLVIEKGNEVWLNVALGTKDEGGSALYAALGNYAYNNDKVFIGDPNGLSAEAVSRRLENMISLALKFGTTRHIAPHKIQRQGGYGVDPVSWIDGNDSHNLRSMIAASYKNVLKQMPELEDFRYDIDKKSFTDGDGNELTGKDIENYTNYIRSTQTTKSKSTGVVRREGVPFTVGSTTNQRAVLTHTFLRGTSEERSRLLAAMRGEHGEHKALNGLLYSLVNTQENPSQKDEARSGGFSASAVEEKTVFGINLDWAVRKIQDKMLPLKKVQLAIKKSGGSLTDEQNAYMAEELFHGKTENDLRKMTERFIEPITKMMADNGIDQAEVDLYLWAKHAEERNIQIAKINPEMPDGGSGMTTAQAEQVLEKAKEEGKQENLEKIATRIYKMLEEKRKVSRYLAGDEMVDSWDNAYKFYVPLKGNAKDEPGFKSGRGFDVRGKESLRALGRRTEPESPLLHAIKDTTETIIRYRKNEVGNALLNLIEANPNPDYWEVYDSESPEFERRITRKRKELIGPPEKGDKRLLSNPQDQVSTAKVINREDYFITKKNGKEYFIRLHDQKLHDAMKNLGPEKLNKIVQMIGGVTRFLSSMSTMYNPEFVVTNFSRDIQAAVINLQAEIDLHDGKLKGKEITARIVKDVPLAMRSVYRNLQNKKPTKQTEEWQKTFDEFRNDGANTGWFQMKDMDQQAADVAKHINLHMQNPMGSLLRVRKAIGDFVTNANSAVENAIRLAVYKNAIEAGISRKQAASLAKNITVNFNRKGEIGAMMNSLYMFFNAAVQGTAAWARAMTTMKIDEKGGRQLNRAQKVAVGIMFASFGLAALNRSTAGEDDDGENFFDKVPDYEKERNIVIMKSMFGGEPGEYWKIPLPYGYNVFSAAAVSAEGVINGNKSIAEGSGGIVKSMLGAFSPIGIANSDSAEGTAARTLTPSVARPFMDIALNENFFGSPVYAENKFFSTEKPQSHLSLRSTNEVWKWLAEALNDNTGGSQYRSGLLDFSPDKMGYTFNYFMGGAGAFYSEIAHDGIRLYQGREIKQKDIPFLRRVSGEVGPYQDQSLFYERKKEIDQIFEEYKSTDDREAFGSKFEKELKLFGISNFTAKRLTYIRKQMNSIKDNESLSEKEKEDQLKPFEVQMKAAIDRFNKMYGESGLN